MENVMTTRQVAEALGVRPNLVHEVGLRLYPNKVRKNGVAVRWTENEVTEISKEVKRTAGVGNSKLYTFGSNQRLGNGNLPSTRQEVLERAGNALKDLLQVIAEMNAEKSSVLIENEMLKHQVEYSEVIGCSRWSDVKKLLRIKDSFAEVVENVELEEGVDYWEKCMGYDTYPTKLLTDSAIERIRELYE